MINLENYSDNELSLDEEFHYTESQRKILIDDLNNEDK